MAKSIGLRLLFSVWVFGCFVACAAIAPTPPRLKPTYVRNDIVFDATFDSGSLSAVQSLSDHRFVVRPRPDYGRDGTGWTHQFGASWSGRTWWYHFSITVPEQHLPLPIELEVDAFKAWVDRMYAADKVPVISCDGVNWRLVDNWYYTGSLNPVISDTLTCPTTYVAMATPYPWTKMEGFLQSITDNPYIIYQEVIGYTPPGMNQDALPLHYLLLSDPGNHQDKRNIVVISGQHPGETTNSWMLTGLVEFLLSDDALAGRLRRAFAFHIYPAVNPEGVKYGHYRRTVESPLNTNRAWNTDEVKEITVVRDHILSQTKGRADYLFDLHGTSLKKHYIYHYTYRPGVRDWIKALAARHPNIATSHGQKWWRSTLPGRSAIRWGIHHLRSHGNLQEPALCFTVEGSYAHGSWKGAPDQAADWKAMGAALVKAICDVEGISD